MDQDRGTLLAFHKPVGGIRNGAKRPTPLEAETAAMPHISEQSLFEAAQGRTGFTTEQAQHLRSCPACLEINRILGSYQIYLQTPPEVAPRLKLVAVRP